MLSAVVAFALTAAGCAVAVVTARRGRYLSATRWAAVALLPAGLYLTGLFSAAATIGGELADWATALVFDPRVWVGIALLAVSAALLITARRIARRRPERTPAAAEGATPARPAADAVPPAATPGSGRGRPSDADLGDFADIEEILRRRGI